MVHRASIWIEGVDASAFHRPKLIPKVTPDAAGVSSETAALIPENANAWDASSHGRGLQGHSSVRSKINASSRLRVTRITAHFAPTGVRLRNPFGYERRVGVD